MDILLKNVLILVNLMALFNLQMALVQGCGWPHWILSMCQENNTKRYYLKYEKSHFNNNKSKVIRKIKQNRI